MIRINLLSPEREKPKRRRAVSSFDASGQKVTVACTLILALAGVGVAWWYWSLQQESSRLTELLANAQQESQRHVDGFVAEVRIGQHQPPVGCGVAEHGKWATLPAAKLGEPAKSVGRDR